MKIINVKEIIQNPGIDGFTAKLEDGNSIDISFTRWNSDEYIEIQENGSIIFNAPNGINILFNKEQVQQLNN